MSKNLGYLKLHEEVGIESRIGNIFYTENWEDGSDDLSRPAYYPVSRKIGEDIEKDCNILKEAAFLTIEHALANTLLTGKHYSPTGTIIQEDIYKDKHELSHWEGNSSDYYFFCTKEDGDNLPEDVCEDDVFYLLSDAVVGRQVYKVLAVKKGEKIGKVIIKDGRFMLINVHEIDGAEVEVEGHIYFKFLVNNFENIFVVK